MYSNTAQEVASEHTAWCHKHLVQTLTLIQPKPDLNPLLTTPTIPLAPTTCVTHVEVDDDDEEMFHDCD
jgi:hypothetical protein